MTYDPARRDRDTQKAAAAKYTTGINRAHPNVLPINRMDHRESH